jgi:hypothetical protein
MAADMLKAQAAIDRFRQLKIGQALTPEDHAFIHDMCDSFEWLKESRDGVMRERDQHRGQVAEVQRALDTANAELRTARAIHEQQAEVISKLEVNAKALTPTFDVSDAKGDR